MRRITTLAAICFTLEARGDTSGNNFSFLEIWDHCDYFSVDATKETSRLGRLMNHSRSNPNCIPRVIDTGKDLKIVFFAKKDIPAGTELLFDYGER